MANKENVPQDATVVNLENQVKEMQNQLSEALKSSSGLTWNNRNWEAVKITLETQEQRLKDLDAKIEMVKGVVMQLQTQFQLFNQQRATELDFLLSNRQTQKDE